MNGNDAKVGMRIVIVDVSGVHEERLVLGMIGTINNVGYSGCSVTFDKPFMTPWVTNDYTTCPVSFFRMEPAPEGAKGTVEQDA